MRVNANFTFTVINTEIIFFHNEMAIYFFCSTEVDVSVMNPRSVKTLVSIIAYIEFRIEIYLQFFLFLMPQGRKQ